MSIFNLPGWKMTYEESWLVGRNGHVTKLERKWMGKEKMWIYSEIWLLNTQIHS